MPPLNLFDTDIHTSPIFKGLPKFSKVSFKGFVEEKIQKYEAESEGTVCAILAAMIIRKDDKDVWEACEDLLTRACQTASSQVHGVYRYDLLSFDVHNEINAFNFQDLTALIVNHSRKLQAGQEELIKYCSCYGLLKKLSAQDWGKVNFVTHVEIFNKETQQFDLYLKRFLKGDPSFDGPVIAVVLDQSLEPILDKSNAAQTDRIKKMLGNVPDDGILPEIYVRDRKKSVELISEF